MQVHLGQYIKAFRFNESGDFYNQACISKLDRIALYLKDAWDIDTYGYTARSDLDFSGVSFIVKGSGFSGNNGKTVVVKRPDDVPEGFFLCPGACSICTACLFNGDVAFILHGRAWNRSRRAAVKKEKGLAKKFGNLEVMLGNMKLPRTTLIFNMGTAWSCPSHRKKLCQVADYCYAYNAEQLYPGVFKYRVRQGQYWLGNSAAKIVRDLHMLLCTKKEV